MMGSWTARTVLVMSLSVGVSGCSTMPGWTRPSAWYDAVTGDPNAVQKATEDKEKADAAAKSDPAGDFPLLSQTPPVPQASTTPTQRRDIRDSLVADREKTNADAAEARTTETPETRGDGKN